MNADLVDTLVTALGAHGSAWWLLGALALSTFLSDDVACFAGGVLVAMEHATFAGAAFACFAGIVVGDLLLVAAGRHFGGAAVARWPFRSRLTPERLRQGERWFARRGGAALLISRFVPGTRLPLYVTAGVLRVSWWKLLGYFCLTALIWAPLLVGLGAWAGDQAQALRNSILHAVLGALGALLLLWLLLALARGLASWRGRRLWLSRWRRLTRWEYWPAWAVYPPVAAYVAWLALHHRGLLVCTAANPGIGAAGGLCGESKSEILRGLAGAGDRVAEWTLLTPAPAEDRLRALAAFQDTLSSRWPVVLKPDVGERGSGVVIARTESEARQKLADDPRPLIAQRYVPGVEFGVFYLRHPGRAGEIFAITEKRTVSVRGDGRSTLERLILADDRAVGMARFFLNQFQTRLEEVPALGETFTLAELGTHCRGALFLDGGSRRTPALEHVVDEVSRAFAGFHFGRYDVRAPSPEAFERGEFTVIELNGLTSEATSIYDPRHSLLHGWRMLCRQWRHAYAIGAANRDAGARVWTLREVLRLFFPQA